jgi:hypothetical protein
MSCEHCNLDHETRKAWACAWVDVSDRAKVANVPPAYPQEYDLPDICPGYLASLPQVIEAARASSWRREGALAQYYDGPITDIAKIAIDFISAEFKAVEQYEIRERSKPKPGGS